MDTRPSLSIDTSFRAVAPGGRPAGSRSGAASTVDLLRVLGAGLPLISFRQLATWAFELTRNRLRRAEIDAAFFDVARALDAAGLDIQVGRARDVSAASRFGKQSTLDATSRAHAALDVYFAQLFGSDRALLDLRPSTFHFDGASVRWTPRLVHVAWDPVFIGGVRRMYRGFFDDDVEQFDRGLDELGLRAARHVVREHLGVAIHRPTTFRATDLQNTLGAIVHTGTNKREALHPDFVPFGLLLAGLYASVSGADQPIDVGARFKRVVG